MSDRTSTIRLVVARGGSELDHARGLFRSYASEFASSIAESLCFQGFEAELASLPGKYASPDGCLLLALDGGLPAGCVALRDLGGGTCEMKRLYVDPAYRGRGVGRRLIEAILERARESGYRRMVLDTLPEMGEAIARYRAFGFVETGPYWDNPIGRALYFEKVLSA